MQTDSFPSSLIKITTKATYLPDHPVEEGQFAFAYRVNIENMSDMSVQLLNRYWLVTTGDGRKLEVSGEGVVGKQPTIEPQQSFSYSSGALLEAPVGTMEGYYEMQGQDGRTFKAVIEPFVLATPHSIN